MAADAPLMDFGIPQLGRDVGDTPLRFVMRSENLLSLEQSILKQIEKVIANQPAITSKLQVAPRGIIDKSIDAEKRNHSESATYKPISIKGLQRNANIISSHHFFVTNFDGERGKLIFRLLLSLANLLRLILGRIYISRAYLQSAELKRDIHMRPLKE
ncbi:unnamed protein product [Agarophyton chilense]